MRWRLKWPNELEARLDAIWIRSPDRIEAENAANRIDQAHRADPLGIGEVFTEHFRRLLDPPLGVIYAVSEYDRLVRLLNVFPVS